MTNEPDFEALRAERNASVLEQHKKLEKEYGVKFGSTFNPNACYCACGSDPKGPCEHKWDGPGWESEDGCASSITCSRCGTTAMSHSLRTGF